VIYEHINEQLLNDHFLLHRKHEQNDHHFIKMKSLF
jgi:hypothetical protein